MRWENGHQARERSQPAQATIVAPDGTVHCPSCGATSFTPARPTATKLMFGALALLSQPQLRCNGCGQMLEPKRPQND